LRCSFSAAEERALNMNVGKLERALRIVAGLVLISHVFIGPKTPWGWSGLILVITGAIRFCPIYRLLGISTCPVKRQIKFFRSPVAQTANRSATASNRSARGAAPGRLDAAGRLQEQVALLSLDFELACDPVTYKITERINRFVRNAVVNARTTAFPRNQPMRGQDGEMARDVRRSIAAQLRQLANVVLAPPQQIKDLKTRRL
jgi:hypothetical protein